MASPSLYYRHRFPAEIISHCVWLYFRFTLSLRDVEEMLAMRGVRLSYETVREWCLKFGQTYTNGLRHKSPRPGDRWHLDEVFLKINGRLHYLWRTVDQDGDVLDILVQSRRDKKAAKKFFRKLLKGLQYVPRVIITDKLRSYSAAKAEVMPSVTHIQEKYQNNRAENSHPLTRLRERVMNHDLQIGFVGLKQLTDLRQLVAQLLLHYYLKLFVDPIHVTICCTQIDSAVELHQRRPPFWRKVGKANAVYFVRFRPPLLIIKSLDASGTGGLVIDNLSATWLSPAASTQPLCANEVIL